jgi:hypothetical protein
MNSSENQGRKRSAVFSSPRFRKRLRRALITLLVLGSLTGATGIFIQYFYEDTVKSIIISQLNKRLNCRIDVSDIEFSIFKRFPYASVHFIDATVYDAYPDSAALKAQEENLKRKHPLKPVFADSVLMKAKDVYLQMSVWDLLFGEYRVKRIEVDDASLQIKIFPDGHANYDIVKPSQDTTDNKKFSFDLQKLLLKNVQCSYVDIPARQDYKFLARDIILKGEFSSDKFEMDVYGNLAVHQIVSHRENYFRSSNTDVDLSMEVDRKGELITFKSGDVAVSGMPLDVLGYVAWGEARRELDLDISGNGLPLQAFLEALPSGWRKYTEDYSGKGRFNFTAKIKGSWADEKVPQFSAAFSLEKGEIIQRESGITLNDVMLKASYTNGFAQNKSTSVIDLSSFSARMKMGNISGNFKMSNFNKPDIRLVAQGNLDLGELHQFVKSDTLSSMSGGLEFNLSYQGQLQSPLGFTANDFVQSASSGSMKLSNANFEFKGQKLQFTGLSGNFRFSNNDVISDDFSGKIGKSDFSIKGYFRNVFAYIFFKDEPLQINADFTSQNIDLDDLLQYQNGSSDTTQLRLDLSPKLDVNFNVRARNFNFGKFTATGITGTLKIRNRQMLVRDLGFNALDGRVRVTGLVDASQSGKLLITCDASIFRADICKMFSQLNNFGQKHLKEENLKGFLSADIQFGSVWSNTFKCDLSTVYANTDITIENGELIHFAPLEGLKDYLKNRDFSDIRFATLKTQISIKDKMILIPPTKIKNDVIDVDFNGTNGFDNQIDYHVSVLYSEIFNKDKNGQSEFGQVEDDGLHQERYFFRITGTTENPVYHKMDKEAYRENIIQKVQTEKQNLKGILNQEFKWFKKDSVKTKDPNKKPDGKKDDQEFKLEWEDE